MENRHDGKFDQYGDEPINDGTNPGHDWARHQSDEPRRTMSVDPDDKDKDEEEEETTLPDWGDIDPQDDPHRPAGPMDPSGPGSAV